MKLLTCCVEMIVVDLQPFSVEDIGFVRLVAELDPAGVTYEVLFLKFVPILSSRSQSSYTLESTNYISIGLGDIENFLPRLLWSLLSRLLQISRY